MVRVIVHATVSKQHRLQGFYIWFVLWSMTLYSLRYVCIPIDDEQRRQQHLQRRRQHYREQRDREIQEDREERLSNVSTCSVDTLLVLRSKGKPSCSEDLVSVSL